MESKVEFESSAGIELSGVLHRPDAGSPRAWVLFAHCFTCTKNVLAARHIADALTREGMAVLRFDFTGLGQSGGDFSETHFSSNVQDLVDAADFLAGEYQAPNILVGHSLGGTAMLAAASEIDSAVAIATIGSPAEAEHVLHLLEDDLETIEKAGCATVKLAGRPFQIRSEFIEDVRNQSVRDGIRNLRKALLVMHSPVDEVVPVKEAGRIYSSAMHPKSYISLDDADHLLSRKADSRYAGRVLSAWVSRFLDVAGEDLPTPAFEAAHVVVAGKTDDAFRVAINADGHVLQGDEPEEHGGADSGPSPYDLLSAALGACTVMTLNMYARHKKLPVESVRVDVQHGKIHAEDCERCETEKGKIDRFERRLTIAGDLSEDQRKRMLEIADRCPVHRTLHSEVEVASRLVE
ncbi:MAG: OsmC family protein [Xanthomonadales bacterium]|nr:bifunctional alpha/beta hydrolase/OsmC family protein [Gammaproteobacteria bacterium]NNL05901.1 OsmC family protein [Xanthomonadales bacterium]